MKKLNHNVRVRAGVAICAALALVGAGAVAQPAAAEDPPAATGIGFLAPYYTAGELTGDEQIDQDDLDALVAALGATAEDEGWEAVSAADYDDNGTITLTDVTQLSQRILYDDGPFELIEASALDMQKAMNAGVTSSVKLTEAYLARIAAYDELPQVSGRYLNSIIATNTKALEIAAASDEARAVNGPTSMLDGIPVILKDNYDTKDMPTTAACGCWEGNQTEDDATMVTGLRNAGAVILAKASMDEFAINLASQISVGGATTNVYSPYNFNSTGSTSGGSSGGTGASIAANLGGIGFGTDTGGSIRIPSSYNQLVGIRPTVGLASRSGIVPLALSQDTGGPMARSVADAAIALDAVVGQDDSDPITAESEGNIPESYTQYLDPNALEGKRIGYVASTLGNNVTVNRLFDQAKAKLEAQGATVEAIAVPDLGIVGGYGSGSVNEFRHDLQTYIDTHLDQDVPYRSLDAIAKSGKVVTGRGSVDGSGNGTYTARAKVTEEQYATYIALHNGEIANGEAIMTAALADNDLDAFIYPTSATYGTIGTNMRLSPNSGMPAVTVPMGQAIAEDATTTGAGVNLELLGANYSEGALIGMAYAFEQATHHRTSPALFPELGE